MDTEDVANLFEHFNKLYFGRLWHVPITIVDAFSHPDPDHDENCRAACITEGDRIWIEIHRLVAERRPGEVKLEGALLHEMCHLAVEQEIMRRPLPRMYRERADGTFIRIKHRQVKSRWDPHGMMFHKYLQRLLDCGAPLLEGDAVYADLPRPYVRRNSWSYEL